MPISPEDVKAACETDCVLVQIEKFMKVLAAAKPNDSTAKKLQKQQALSFIVHFIGDVHQPLHAADRNGDHGGNAEHVKFFNSDQSRKLVLHTIWDNQIVFHVDKKDSDLVADLKPEIASASKENPTQPMDWALESYGFARDVAYKNIPEAKTNASTDVANLGQPYQDKAAPMVRSQRPELRVPR